MSVRFSGIASYTLQLQLRYPINAPTKADFTL